MIWLSFKKLVVYLWYNIKRLRPFTENRRLHKYIKCAKVHVIGPLHVALFFTTRYPITRCPITKFACHALDWFTSCDWIFLLCIPKIFSKLTFFLAFCHMDDLLLAGLLCLNSSSSTAARSSDYRPKRTPLRPITIIYLVSLSCMMFLHIIIFFSNNIFNQCKQYSPK